MNAPSSELMPSSICHIWKYALPTAMNSPSQTAIATPQPTMAHCFDWANAAGGFVPAAEHVEAAIEAQHSGEQLADDDDPQRHPNQYAGHWRAKMIGMVLVVDHRQYRGHDGVRGLEVDDVLQCKNGACRPLQTTRTVLRIRVAMLSLSSRHGIASIPSPRLYSADRW